MVEKKKEKSQPDEKEQEALAKQMQEKYMELQMLEQQVKMVQQQLEKFDQQVQEINMVEEGLEKLKTMDKDAEMFVPLTSGIFVKAKLEDTKELVVNVGSNTAVKKTVDETISLLKDQAREIEKYKVEVEEQFQKMGARMQMLQKELEDLANV